MINKLPLHYFDIHINFFCVSDAINLHSVLHLLWKSLFLVGYDHNNTHKISYSTFINGIKNDENAWRWRQKKRLKDAWKPNTANDGKGGPHCNLHRVNKKKLFAARKSIRFYNWNKFPVLVWFQVCVCVCGLCEQMNTKYIAGYTTGSGIKRKLFQSENWILAAFRNAQSENSHEQTKTNVTHGINRAWLKWNCYILYVELDGESGKDTQFVCKEIWGFYLAPVFS